MKIRIFLKILHCIILWIGMRKDPFSIFIHMKNVWVYLCAVNISSDGLRTVTVVLKLEHISESPRASHL